MRLRTAFGLGVLKLWHGQDSAEGHWGCPICECWGLSALQRLSPALEDKRASFGPVTGSYAAAAQQAARVGLGVEDSTIPALVRRLGATAEAPTQARLQTPALEKQPARPPTSLAVLMLDGFQVRFRGPGWGKKKTVRPRVEWPETKLGVFYRNEQAVGEKRRQLLEKMVVSWQDEGCIPKMKRLGGRGWRGHGKEQMVWAEFASLPRRQGQRGRLIRGGTRRLCRASRADALSDTGTVGLADWQRPGGVGLSLAAMSTQAQWTILGRSQGCDTGMPSKEPATMATGMNAGSPRNPGSAKSHSAEA